MAEANETVKSLTRMLEFWSSRIRQRQSKVAEEQENAGADERDGFSDWDQVLNATRRSCAMVYIHIYICLYISIRTRTHKDIFVDVIVCMWGAS